MSFEDRLQIAIEEKRNIVQESGMPGTAGLYEKIDNLLIVNARQVDTVTLYYRKNCIYVEGKVVTKLELSELGVVLDKSLTPSRLIYYISSRYEYCPFIKTEEIEVDDQFTSSRNSGLRITFLYPNMDIKTVPLKDKIKEVRDEIKAIETGDTWKMEVKISALSKTQKINAEILRLVASKQNKAYILIRGNNILLKTDDKTPDKKDFFKSFSNNRCCWEIEVPKQMDRKGLYLIKEQNMIGQEIFDTLIRYYREQGIEVESYEYSEKNLMSLVSLYNVYKFKLTL